MDDDGKQYFAVCVKCDEMPLVGDHFHCTQYETIECLPTRVEFSVPEKYVVEQMNCVLFSVCKDCS